MSYGSGGKLSVRALLVTVLVVGLAIAGCGGESDDEGSAAAGLPEGEIVIGAPIAKTGYLAPYDATIAAVEHYFDKVNAAGGINGRKLRLITADNRSDPQQAGVVTQEVIEKGAQALIVTCEAATAAAEAAVAQEHNKLNITMCANEPGYGPPATGRLSFIPMPSLLSDSAARAQFLHDRGIKRPFLMRDTSLIYGKADCDVFQQAWEGLGGEIAGSADFQNGDSSVATQVGQLRKSGADAVSLCSYPPGGATAIKQIRDAGIDLPISTPSTFDGTYWHKGIRDLDNIFVSLIASSYDPPSKEIADLYDELEQAGVDLDVSSTLVAAYAAAELLVEAIKGAQTLDGDALADELEAKSHKTIIGDLSFTAESHHTEQKAWNVYEIVDGKYRLDKNVEAESVPTYEP